MSDDAVLEAIYNFRRRSPILATGGQPTEEELIAVARAGFEVVIDLALLDADYSLPDEPGLVQHLGMTFCHIPVVWEAPTLANLRDFFEAMRRYEGRRIFLHCAANMRATAFLALHRMLNQGWPHEAAMAEVRDVWEPDAVWQAFMNQALAQMPIK